MNILTYFLLLHAVVIALAAVVVLPLALWAGKKWPSQRHRELRRAWMMGIAIGFYLGLGTVWIGGMLGSLIGPTLT